MTGYPFRWGTTSYIIPADILPNVRYLATKVQDVELVLFEMDDGLNNLPGKEQIAELAAIAADHDLTYTVHLPLDLRLADDGSFRHISLEKARRVIDCTRNLDPWAYVLHLDGRAGNRASSAGNLPHWQEQAVRSLTIVGEWAGDVTKLAVENLEGYPLDFYDPVLSQIAVSRAVDLGHLWLDRRDPIAFLQSVLPRTRVIHLHGVADRDHKSLAHVPAGELRAVLAELVRSHYNGVVTVEVFSEDDLLTSLAVLAAIENDDVNRPEA